MNLVKLDTIVDLGKFIPELTRLHESFDGKWEPELDTQSFIAKLIQNFDNRSWYFGENNESGTLKYFIAMLEDAPKACFWLFYVNPTFRNETKELLDALKIFVKQNGITTCYATSNRMTSSYERWIEKHGAKKHLITYKFDL